MSNQWQEAWDAEKESMTSFKEGERVWYHTMPDSDRPVIIERVIHPEYTIKFSDGSLRKAHFMFLTREPVWRK